MKIVLIFVGLWLDFLSGFQYIWKPDVLFFQTTKEISFYILPYFLKFGKR